MGLLLRASVSLVVCGLAASACNSMPAEPQSRASSGNATSVASSVASGGNVKIASAEGAATKSKDWNDSQIAWRSYEAGMAEAKAQHKPVLLVVYTQWCPHCRNYAKVFEDPRVIRKAQDLVMIRVDADAESAVNERYSPDGKYIPRTFSMSSEGKLQGPLHPDKPEYKYFYDERDPGDVLEIMARAVAT